MVVSIDSMPEEEVQTQISFSPSNTCIFKKIQYNYCIKPVVQFELYFPMLFHQNSVLAYYRFSLITSEYLITLIDIVFYNTLYNNNIIVIYLIVEKNLSDWDATFR
jgi:hypothetical protein